MTTKKQPLTKAEHSEKKRFFQSPLNYTGGKFKLLPQISELIPPEIDVFYDVFSGGANVAINVACKTIKAIDSNEQLISLMNFFKNQRYCDLYENMLKTIDYYHLSNSFDNGYDYYNCNSSNGLGSYNKERYMNMRADYNENPSDLLFLLLIIYGFNNQIRFNKSGHFNMPVGKRDFNASTRKKLQNFMEQMHNKDITFACKDFRALNIDALVQERAFLYLDPPYLLGVASYNESNGWTEKDETDLLNFLTNCSKAGIRFALSNVIEHKGQTHEQLKDVCASQKFTIHDINHNYTNSNYQLKDKKSGSKEVLITNYSMV